MKILAFVDVHGDLRALKKIEEKAKEADLIVCAGDISMFEQGLDMLLDKINSIGKPVLMIHGNHESEDLMKKECKTFKNIEFIHKKTYEKEDVIFIGYGGGGFSLTDDDFEKFGKKILNQIKKGKKKKIVIVTHAPPYGIKLDLIGEHNGNKSITEFIEKAKPKFSICGHFHEFRGEFDYIGKTEVLNPGPYGRVIEV